MNKSAVIKTKVTKTYDDFNIFAEYILNKEPPVVGLDTETIQRINEKAMGVDLIQICIKDDTDTYDFEEKINGEDNYVVYIFTMTALNNYILPTKLKKILESRKIVKVGCDITTDVKRMKQKYEFNEEGFIDTQLIAISTGLKTISLNDLSEKYLGISKKGKSSYFKFDYNYASYDAYLSLLTYLCLINNINRSEEINNNNNNLDGDDVFNYLVKKTYVFSSKNPTNKEKIINMLSNSYKPWNKTLTKEQIKNNVDILIAEWVDSGKIQMGLIGDISLTKENSLDNEMDIKKTMEYYNQYFSSIESTNKDIVDNEMLKKIEKIIPPNGMKLESIRKWIANSFYQNETSEIKMEKSSKIIQLMIYDKKLQNINNKYVIRK